MVLLQSLMSCALTGLTLAPPQALGGNHYAKCPPSESSPLIVLGQAKTQQLWSLASQIHEEKKWKKSSACLGMEVGSGARSDLLLLSASPKGHKVKLQR